jgi:hypothetical protein
VCVHGCCASTRKRGDTHRRRGASGEGSHLASGGLICRPAVGFPCRQIGREGSSVGLKHSGLLRLEIGAQLLTEMSVRGNVAQAAKGVASMTSTSLDYHGATIQVVADDDARAAHVEPERAPGLYINGQLVPTTTTRETRRQWTYLLPYQEFDSLMEMGKAVVDHVHGGKRDEAEHTKT